MIRVLIFIFILTVTVVNFLSAEEYFSTLRYNNVNLRQGPSKDYPIKIFYKKKYLPVLVLDKSNNFRKIIDHENNSGWIHISQLSKKKSALIIDEKILIYKKPTIYSKPLAILERGRLCNIVKCQTTWCKIKVANYTGWIKRKSLWGRL